MKNNIITIFKKECTRIFMDRRLFLTAVVMPGVMIYVMYTLVGNFTSNMISVAEDYKYQIHVVNMPESVNTIVSQVPLNINVIPASEADIESLIQRISDRNTDLLMVFPPDFDELVAAFDITSGETAPTVTLWGNQARSESSSAYYMMSDILEKYHYSLTHRFSIEGVDLATDADIFGAFMGALVAMLFILFIFSGCQAIAPESIAGEKERGTLGTILVTPTKRRDMAFGKILSISLFGLMSAVVSMIAIMLSMPNMVNLGSDTNTNFYEISDFLLLGVIAVFTTLLFVAILSVLSAYAKSVKEATALTMPVMIVTMLCGMAGMLTGGGPDEIIYYLIPVFNSAQCVTAIMQFEASVGNIAVTIAANTLYVLICVALLAKMFNSEKIVFDK
ncbi:MAG: ABC transporter permease subunit [Lachnospiraceae bacterium]|jgi:sodium transport system permease protein|nr:ABC transporter permease subunit [Lachnospiraceae bacterium]